MEMNMGKFSEKLVELLELAKKKKNVLEYQEISDFFKDQPLEVEQMEKVFDFLEASGVDVLRITDGNADDMILDDVRQIFNARGILDASNSFNSLHNCLYSSSISLIYIPPLNVKLNYQLGSLKKSVR